MASRSHLLALGLGLLVVVGVGGLGGCGNDDGGDGSLPVPEPGMSESRPGWNLSRVPTWGKPLRERELDHGVIMQVTGTSDGPVVEDGEPVDIEYRIHTLDGGPPRDHGVLPNIVLGTHNALPPGFVAGLAGIRVREKRRILIPAGHAHSPVFPSLPPHRAAVFDIRPVRLKITDLVVGTGPEVAHGDTIDVAYKGMFEDGRTFHAVERANVVLQPARMGSDGKLHGVIRGWVEGVPGMRVGGKRRLWVPSHLAYGALGSGAEIPPFSDLVYEIEVLEAK